MLRFARGDRRSGHLCMFGFFKKYWEARAAQKALTLAFKARGHDFMTMNSIVHEALVKEAVATDVEATMKNFDRAKTIFLGRDEIIEYYRARSKTYG